jgi:hypothetical protein
MTPPPRIVVVVIVVVVHATRERGRLVSRGASGERVRIRRGGSRPHAAARRSVRGAEVTGDGGIGVW